jgi:hypothetical protein
MTAIAIDYIGLLGAVQSRWAEFSSRKTNHGAGLLPLLEGLMLYLLKAALASVVVLLLANFVAICCETISIKAGCVAIVGGRSQGIKQQHSSDDIPVQAERRQSRHSRGYLTSSWSGQDAGALWGRRRYSFTHRTKVFAGGTIRKIHV